MDEAYSRVGHTTAIQVAMSISFCLSHAVVVLRVFFTICRSRVKFLIVFVTYSNNKELN